MNELHHQVQGDPLRCRDILSTWWPLAASWLMMSIEMPMVVTAISRMHGPDVQLAAFGGVVFPLALLFEAPIMMMLPASVALVVDKTSYRVLYRFMTRLSIVLTVLVALLACTPLFGMLARDVLGVPGETIDPAQRGLQLMIPWMWAIADRRMHQGILIRYGYQVQVGVGTIFRLIGSGSVLYYGYLHPHLPGIMFAAGAFTVGALVEAVYVRWCVRKVCEDLPVETPSDVQSLTFSRLWFFYLPLAITPLIGLLTQPIGSAGMSRLPGALLSLAAWPAVSGLRFVFISIGMAYQEVVIRHAGATARGMLTRFGLVAGFGTSIALGLVAASPVGGWFFGTVMGIEDHLVSVATAALWWAVPHPFLTFLVSCYQGQLVHAGRTRAVTEATCVFLLLTAACFVLAVMAAWDIQGATVAMIAVLMGDLGLVAWLWWRCRTL